MIYQGRSIDPVSLWSDYVQFPLNMDMRDEFSPLVQCPNPNHSTTKAHFQINLKKPLVHCFARCGISGTYEHALAIVLGLTTAEGMPDERSARKIVLRASRLSFGGKKEPLRVGSGKRTVESGNVESDQLAFQNGDYNYLGATAIRYLDKRGITQSSCRKWQLGFDQEANRLVIPAFDIYGTFRFLIRRAIGNQHPKYLYTTGGIKNSLLMGACNVDRDTVRSDGLILVEGSLDAIRLHQEGYRNAVAILGTGLSKRQRAIIDRLGPRRVYCLFDKDSAGAENILWAHFMLKKYPIFICRYPPHRDDPAEMTRKEVERVIERAMPASTFFKKAKISLKRRPKGEPIAI